MKTLGPCPSSLNGGLFSYINDSIIQNNIIPIQQEVAREYGLQVIDLHTLFADGQDMVQPDGIHPNEKGVKRMAEIIAEKLLAP